MASEPFDWKWFYNPDPDEWMKKRFRAMLNLEQVQTYLRSKSLLIGPDRDAPQKNGETQCLVCDKLLCVLTSASPFWFELGSPSNLLRSSCRFHTPIILHSIAAGVNRTHVESLKPPNPCVDSPVHASRHHSPGSLLVFQDGLVHTSYHSVRKDVQLQGHGKLINREWIDTGLLRSWKRSCLEDHGDRCDFALPKAASELLTQRPQLLIDTWRMCLTDASGDQSYIALSYVWGNCNTFRTSTKNLTELKRDHALSHAIRDSSIPNTIVHAMHFVGILEERYLWVDALCIVQDDDASKHQQLRSMASIYANSVLTIIAAEGHDANHGICGLRNVSEPRNCQQHVFQLPGDTDIIHVPWPEMYDKTWFSRGWTFQEWLFSSRRLMFGDARVRWQCPCSNWQEDVDHLSGLDVAPFPIGPDDDRVLTRALSSTWPNIETYASIVQYYNTRKFSLEEDVLPAFSGITSLLVSTFDGGFLYGLPEMFFDDALLWLPFPRVTRRIATDTSAPFLRGSLLPSWSWMGWCGEIDGLSWLGGQSNIVMSQEGGVRILESVEWSTGFPSASAQQRRRIVPSGRKYSEISDNDPVPPGWTRHQQEDGSTVYTHPKNPNALYSYPIPMSSTLNELPGSQPTHPQTPLLFFTTTRAWLHGIRYKGNHRPGVTLRCEDGSWAGFLNLHNYQTARKFPVTGRGEMVELLAISTGAVTHDGYAPQLDEMKMAERPRDGGEYRFVNVLFVTWDDGVAYRQGLGRVLASVWESAERESVDVTLG
ncbi:heterokaryon incompatibility protein-domain-containing protein [Lasiosphaeria miniovina]|uniref:Heterokaryon incompatibility protein-domain-containing protein n=1 Tax=Lasiosphaeria miniovina TaxID=1954250 RepID=A0AA40B4Y4_9PEZI|nr:heterokaryon incompatibility protein-domain-containing protein [Lasiosphaeria miniovina]KAK0727622.1 heterokaryon incompatibility protein-domain-containing protein [Lasiosphaeria miniovina]